MTERNRDKYLLFALGCALSVILSIVGIIALIWKGVGELMRSACTGAQVFAQRAWFCCRKCYAGGRWLCLWLPLAFAVVFFAFGVYCTPDKEEGRFIPRREEPGCPCCRAVLVHRCIDELGEWRHVFQHDCLPALERLADKLRATAPPSPRP